MWRKVWILKYKYGIKFLKKVVFKIKLLHF